MATAWTDRVGQIATAVGIQFNDTAQQNVTDADILQWCNEAQDNLTREGGFLKMDTFDSAASETYTLITVLSDFVAMRQLVWSSTGAEIVPAPSWAHYQQARVGGLSGAPQCYFILSGTLYTTPACTAITTDAFQAFYHYRPHALTGVTDYDNPYSPAIYDQYYVEWCLYRAFQRKEADTYQRTVQKAPEYYQRAMQLQGQILGNRTPNTRLTPYR